MNLRILPERWDRIIQFADTHGEVTVDEISRELAISKATVRRDLARIEERGLIERTRGGAVLPSHISVGPTLAESRRICPREKELIGREAAMLVSEGDTIVIDGGYTTYQVAINLKARDLSVVTNSLDVVQALLPRDDVTLILVGGKISRTSGTTVGPISEDQLHHFNAAKAILGADAIDPDHGLCSPLHSTAQTKQAMIGSARELIVVADAGKLGRSALYRVAPPEAVSTLVTDDRADPDILEAFRASGTEVIVATAGGLPASRKDG